MGNADKRRLDRAKRQAAKETAMREPGFTSKYAKRKARRANGEPLAARSNPPYWIAQYSGPPPNPVYGPFKEVVIKGGFDYSNMSERRLATME